MRWLTFRRRDRDRGATTILIAVLVPVFLLLVGGLIIDVGSWYSVRAQSQNGADAAAIAVAESCARSTCDVTLANASTGLNYSNYNSNKNLSPDGATARIVCFDSATASSQNLTACSNVASNPCPGAPSSGANYVDVQTISIDKVGLAGTLLNNQSQVAACAQATWGAANSCGNCIPLTISLCEWYLDTDNGQTFATAPANAAYGSSTSPYTAPPSYLDTITARRNSAAFNTDGTSTVDSTNYYRANNIKDPHNPILTDSSGKAIGIAGSETVLVAKSSKGVSTSGFGSGCHNGSDASNQTGPGQFGWLCKGSGGNACACTAPIGSTYGGSTGAPPADCEAVFEASRSTATPVYLPVYSNSATGSGSNLTYTLAGFAAFVITGWGGLNSGKGFSTTTCDSIITLNDLNPPDKSLAWSKAPADTSCTGGSKASTDFADYCTNYVGANNCNGSAVQAIYGYFTQALIPASDLPGAGGQCSAQGLPRCTGATAVFLTG